MVSALVYELAGVAQFLDRFFLHFLSLVLMRKLVFYAQTKLAGRRRMHTGFPFPSDCVLGGCAALICNQSCTAII